MTRLVQTVQSLYAEILKFGAVGAVGVLTDVGASNLLWKYTGIAEWLGAAGGTAAATVVAYIGNRYWTFRHRPDDDRRREMLLFALISAIGMVIEVGAVFISSHYLDLHGTLADNAAKFGVGLPVAGVFRFWACHVFVFPEVKADDREVSIPAQRVGAAAVGE